MSTSLRPIVVVGVIGLAAYLAQPMAPAGNRNAREEAEQVGDNAATATPAAEQPFRESAQLFVDAYARQDAEAIAKLFTEDAEFYDEFGEVTEGREAIAELFRQVFETTPDALVEEIDIERVRMIGDDVALEEGTVATSPYPGGPREVSRYIALHVKQRDGVWRINTLKDYTREKGTSGEQLSQLAWMVGEWVSEDDSSVVHTVCDWSDDGNFLLRRFTVQIAGSPVMNGVQRMGWDPLRREIRSWVFDSDGGYVEGVWKRNGDQWLVTSSGYNSSGEPASGVAVYTLLDQERVVWQYRSLVVGNKLREDIEPIVMVREPPRPNSSE